MNRINEAARSILRSAIPIVAVAVVVGPVLPQSGRGEASHERGKQGVQQGQAGDEAAKPEPRILPLDSIVGASVHRKTAGGEDTQDGDADRPGVLGRIEDLVVHTRSGSVRGAVISIGGKRAKVEWSALLWEPRESRFVTTMTREQAESLPLFDRKEFERSTSGGGASVERGGDGDIAYVPELILASGVGDCAVMAQTEELGSTDKVFVEQTTGTVALLSVEVGGVLGIGASSYVLPWDALQLVETPEGKQLRVQKSKESLEAAPKLNDDGADVGDAAFRKKVYAFYGVPAPAFEGRAEDPSPRREEK